MSKWGRCCSYFSVVRFEMLLLTSLIKSSQMSIVKFIIDEFSVKMQSSKLKQVTKETFKEFQRPAH